MYHNSVLPSQTQTQEHTYTDLVEEVTRKCRHFTGSHLEEAVEGLKLAYTEHFTSYKAVARSRRQSRDRKGRHVTSVDRKCPGSDSFDGSNLEVAVEFLKLACTVYFSSYKAVARSRRHSLGRK